MCECNSFKLWLLQTVALLGVLALALWLSMRPKSPDYTIVNFSALSPSNDTSFMDNPGGQNGTLLFFMEIKNPGKYSYIYYDNINLTCFQDQTPLGSATIASFRQGKSTTTAVTTSVNVESKVWKELLKSKQNKSAELLVGVASRIRFRTLGIKSKRRGMQMNGRFSVGPDGKIPGNKKIKLRNGSIKWKIKPKLYR